MSVRFTEEEFVRLKDVLLVSEWGQKTLLTKLEIISADFKNFHGGSPIEHITGRIKSPESIAEKLSRLNLAVTADNARRNLTDIAGIRVICQFTQDIYTLADILRAIPDARVLTEKDYVSRPKPSGYRSFHMIMEVPVFFSGKTEAVTVEVQIRTEAMDFWAALEHRVRYKFDEHIPAHLSDELVVCADKIAELDNRMFLIHEIILLINQQARI